MLKLVQHDASINIFNHCQDLNPDLHNSFAQQTVKDLSPLTSHFSRKRIAFTLAEVLITLGIIGVVAALTMPVLIANHQEKQTVVKLKKVYSTLGQALNMAIADNGTVDQWGLEENKNVTQEDGTVVIERSGTENLCKIFSKYLNGNLLKTGWNNDLKVSNMQKQPLENSGAQPGDNAPTTIELNDGTILNFSEVKSHESCVNNDYCAALYVILPQKNGIAVQGINYFSFFVMKDRIIPWGIKGDKYNDFESRCNMSINHRASGRGCTAWVLYNENMDYLHCNDLSWDGKTKCK